MGESITAERAAKIEANRAAGRLCRGAHRSRAGCPTRATVGVRSESWTYLIGEGPRFERVLPMCRRHAKQSPEGFEGKNFRVLGHVVLS